MLLNMFIRTIYGYKECEYLKKKKKKKIIIIITQKKNENKVKIGRNKCIFSFLFIYSFFFCEFQIGLNYRPLYGT